MMSRQQSAGTLLGKQVNLIQVDRNNSFAPRESWSGYMEEGFREADEIHEDWHTTGSCHNASMEPRSCLAHWEEDKLTLYPPTQGISNGLHDMPQDPGLSDHNVQAIQAFT